jgi:hypothetical protein
MGWGVLFMGIGGEFVLTLEGLTEKAISHWLRFQELARHDGEGTRSDRSRVSITYLIMRVGSQLFSSTNGASRGWVVGG